MKFLGKEISGKFTIPSGIVTTDVKTILRIAKEIPQIGVITTKSVCLEPREGNREPIYTKYSNGNYMNAVGLTNPGAKEFAEQLSKIELPKTTFLLTSIFGKDKEEYVQVAKLLAPYSDALELNLSCPHAKGYGMAMGQDPNLVKEITAAVKQAVDIPVIPKLTPNTANFAEIAKAAAEGGADAICAINTVGPGYFDVDGHPVLSNKMGGMSGSGILPIGLKCVKECYEATKLPVVGCGGVSSANDVRSYQNVGAEIIGIGSALTGLSTNEMKHYFANMQKDLDNNTNEAVKLLKKTNMGFEKFTLVENQRLADDLAILTFDRKYDIKPGEFIFAWIPGIGEKPFSVLDDNPLTLAILKIGCFTSKAVELKKGAEVYIRGNYGNPVEIKEDQKIILVSGGTGLAANYHIARDFPNTESFVGARDKDHLFYTEKLEKVSKTFLATNDGSVGHEGFVTVPLKERLEELKGENLVFYNCGPEPMINAVTKMQLEYTSADKIFNAIDFVTKCGVGICGSCSTKKGKRLCVDGPFIGEDDEN